MNLNELKESSAWVDLKNLITDRMEELESINGFDSSIDFEKQIFARLQVIQELQWVINLVEGDAKKAKRPGLNSMEGYIKRQA